MSIESSPQAIQFIDLGKQLERIRPAIDQAVQRVLDHGQFIMGPEVKELEDQLARFTGSKHCISVSNGTDALVVSLMALDVGPGDAVITTPFTFFATVEAILAVGAVPVFADIDRSTFNLCPAEVEKQINRIRSSNQLNLKGIIAVDLFGLCADYPKLKQLANEHELFIIQDGAQSFGAICEGRRSPSHCDIGTTSFFPAKPLGAYGDGGAVFTDDDRLAELVESIRIHGKGSDKYDNVRLGQNARLDTIQAAILLEKLKIYPDEIERRQEVANRYRELLDGALIGFRLPEIPESYTSVWAQYTLLQDANHELSRDQVAAKMHESGVPTSVYYRKPSHLLGACQHLGYRPGDFPVSEHAAESVLSLPFHPYLTTEAQQKIADSLANAAR